MRRLHLDLPPINGRREADFQSRGAEDIELLRFKPDGTDDSAAERQPGDICHERHLNKRRGYNSVRRKRESELLADIAQERTIAAFYFYPAICPKAPESPAFCLLNSAGIELLIGRQKSIKYPFGPD
jgi:hypothetical protein